MKDIRTLRILACAPFDVAAERAKIEWAAATLEPLADHVGVRLEVIDWRSVVPNPGLPRQLILDQLHPTSWDIFIGILWHRFESATGGTGAPTGASTPSGTDQEFRAALELWRNFGRPRVSFYRCMRPVRLDQLDPDQYKKVQSFFADLDAPGGTQPGLAQSFETTEGFANLLFDQLQKLLIAYSKQESTRPLTPQAILTLTPTRRRDNLPRRAPFFGRQEELTKMLRAMLPEDRGWGVVISGIGGIGKTALAIEAAYLCKERALFEDFIFVSAKAHRLNPTGIVPIPLAPQTLDQILNDTARALGQPGILQLVGAYKLQALFDALQGTHTLLLFDNLETLPKEGQEALAEFLQTLPPGCKAILTSRRQGGDGARWLRLDRLDWDTARAIMLHEAEADNRLAFLCAEENQVQQRELFQETGGSPLALLWTLGLIRVRGLGFERAIEMLQRGAQLGADLQRFIYDEAVGTLTNDARTALTALSYFPLSASFESWRRVGALSTDTLDQATSSLTALALVNPLQSGER
ncbi:MAG: ATP-binding protein, partial [Chloroflexi bacterium]|nr:ATP-binding protein [Chloroflexota bacterium]